MDVREIYAQWLRDFAADADTVADITTRLSHKFTQDDDYIAKELKGSLHRTLLLKLTPEHTCGKVVTES